MTDGTDSRGLAARVEAFLFAEGSPVSFRKLKALLEVGEGDLNRALEELSNHLDGSGLTLIRSETEASLATAPEVSDAVKKALADSLSRDIGEAGLEVLAILLYHGPSTRARIDYIRGVNTSSTVRTLLARGLVERSGNPEDGREYLYRPTVELLAHLGVSSMRELPDHATISRELAAFEEPREPFGETEDHEQPNGVETKN